MSFEFIARNGLIAQNDSIITGSLTVTGTITATTLVAQTITSSTSWITGSTKFGSITSNTHQFTGSIYQSGSEAIFAGNVGISTTNPDVFSRSYNGKILGISSLGQSAIELNGAAGSAAYIDMGVNGTRYLGLYSDASSSDISTVGAYPLTFGTNSTTRMTITSGGNVGIGTTSPSYRLDVVGTGRFTETLYLAEGNPASYGLRIGNVKIGSVSTTSNEFIIYNLGTTAGTGAIRFGDSINYDYDEWAGLEYHRNGRLMLGGPSSFTNNGTPDSVSTLVLAAYSTSDFVITGSNGYVGIGNSSPSYLLDVAGTSRSDLHIFRSNQSAPTADAFIFRPADNTVALGTANTERLRINSSGNVGIGTTSPSSVLHIESTNPFVRISNASTGDGGIKISYQNSNTHGLHLLYNPGSAISYIDNTYPTSSGQAYGDIYFRQNVGGTMTTRMMIKADGGNVGIGTTSPAYKLEVNGNITARDTISTYTSGGTQTTALSWTSTNNGLLNLLNGGTLNIQLLASGNSYFNGGNVGIGTTSPAELLDVMGTVRSKASEGRFRITSTGGTGREYDFIGGNDGKFYFYDRTAGSYRYVIDSNGNVGIGTTSPRSRLEVTAPNTAATTNYTSKNIIANSPLVGGYTGAPIVSMLAMYDTTIYAADIGYLYDTTGYGLAFSVNNDTSGDPAEAMRINRSGNVGIGTTSPGYKLEVAGDISIYKSGENRLLYMAKSDGATTVQLNSSGVSYLNGGNVGIGTTSPQNLLQVGSLTSATNVGGTTWNQVARFGSSNRLTSIVIQAAGTGAVSGSQGLPAIEFEPYNVDASSKIKTAIVAVDNYYAYRKTDLAFILDSADDLNPWTLSDAKLYIKNDGNVGIGTTSPSAKLHVNGTFISNALWTDATAIAYWGNYSTAFGRLTWDTGYAAIYAQSGNALYLGANATHMVINTSGNVGIGTTSPNVRLRVIGGSSTFQFALKLAKSTYADSGGHTTLIGLGCEDASWSRSAIGHTRTTSYDAGYLGFYVSNNNGDSNELVASDLRMMINRDGNVGIGTTSPNSKLEIYGGSLATGGGGMMFASQLTTGRTGTYDAGTLGSIHNYYDASSTELTAGSSAGYVSGISVTGNNATLYQGTVRFTTAGSERMRINNSGNVGIGTTSPAYALDVSGTIRATGDVIAYSDARVKENVETITDALTKVTSLRGVSYTRNDSEDKSTKVGVIAQEVLDILPEVVQQDDNGNYSVAYGNIVGVLIEAIKELKAEINELKNNK